MGLHTIIYMNGDTKQRRQFSADNKPMLQDLIEKRIRQWGVHAFDGATLGKPEEGHPHISISFVEGTPANYAWEITDNRSAYWHLRPDQLDFVECFPMEQAFHKFIMLCLEFAEHCNQWPTNVEDR